MHLIELCQTYVDVWINDMRFEIDKILTLKENTVTFESLKFILKQGRVDVLYQPRYLIAFAMILSDIKRHGLKMINVSDFIKAFGDRWHYVKLLRDMMTTLPKLTNGKGEFLPDIKEKALNSFEVNARFVAKTLKLDINPTLVDETDSNGRINTLWTF